MEVYTCRKDALRQMNSLPKFSHSSLIAHVVSLQLPSPSPRSASTPKDEETRNAKFEGHASLAETRMLRILCTLAGRGGEYTAAWIASRGGERGREE